MYTSGSFAVGKISRVATVEVCAAARECVGAKGIEPGVAARTGAPATPGSPALTPGGWQNGAAGAPGK